MPPNHSITVGLEEAAKNRKVEIAPMGRICVIILSVIFLLIFSHKVSHYKDEEFSSSSSCRAPKYSIRK